jgi:hypothetical protein
LSRSTFTRLNSRSVRSAILPRSSSWIAKRPCGHLPVAPSITYSFILVTQVHSTFLSRLSQCSVSSQDITATALAMNDPVWAFVPTESGQASRPPELPTIGSTDFYIGSLLPAEPGSGLSLPEPVPDTSIPSDRIPCSLPAPAVTATLEFVATQRMGQDPRRLGLAGERMAQLMTDLGSRIVRTTCRQMVRAAERVDAAHPVTSVPEMSQLLVCAEATRQPEQLLPRDVTIAIKRDVEPRCRTGRGPHARTMHFRWQRDPRSTAPPISFDYSHFIAEGEARKGQPPGPYTDIRGIDVRFAWKLLTSPGSGEQKRG